MRKYTLDESIFENIDTEEKAYWLGFILADGSISSKRNSLKIALSIKDKEHLIKFLLFLSSNSPIKIYSVGNGLNSNKSKSCECTIYSPKIVQDLKLLGIEPNKSHTVEIPTIDKKLEKHLIRGIWDGDGSILYRAQRKEYPKNISPVAQICGNKKVLTKINDIFQEELGLKSSKLSKVSSIFLFRKSTNSAKKVINYLYKDCSIALSRKYDTAILCMNWSARK